MRWLRNLVFAGSAMEDILQKHVRRVAINARGSILACSVQRND